MEIVRRVHSMREIVQQARGRGLRIGFVPTMGCLHEGHLSLIRCANERVDVVVVSIFVNPTQFGPGEDFESYPRDLTRDADLCIAEGVDYLFTPEAAEIYPPGIAAIVDLPELSGRLEGVSRPEHFRGVATVVLKLFHVVQPHVAVFGQKDAQQAVLIRRMARDLLLDVEIVVEPTARDEDGLALSSRNAYLTAEQRRSALAIPRALAAARHVFHEGQSRPDEIVEAAREVLASDEALEIDYVELVDAERLEPVESATPESLLLIAARCGPTRLLDNGYLGGEPGS